MQFVCQPHFSAKEFNDKFLQFAAITEPQVVCYGIVSFADLLIEPEIEMSYVVQ